MAATTRTASTGVITNPTAPSNLRAAQQQGGAVAAAEQRKERDYAGKRLQEKLDCNGPLLPIGLETYGTFGKGALKMVDRVHSHAKTIMREDAANDLRRNMLDEMAISCAKGVAMAILNCLRRSRAKCVNTHWWPLWPSG